MLGSQSISPMNQSSYPNRLAEGGSTAELEWLAVVKWLAIPQGALLLPIAGIQGHSGPPWPLSSSGTS